MMMVTGLEFLIIQLSTVQLMQYILTLADKTASSHELKLRIREQLVALDQLETQLQVLAAQRGWELPELSTIRKVFHSIRFHCRTDPAIAEYLINQYTEGTIYMMRTYNNWPQGDRSIRNQFQKTVDCCAVGIRQMLTFL